MRLALSPASLSAILLLAGCTGPTIQTEQLRPINARASWRTEISAMANVDGAWWRSFGDPRLTALVERALRENSDLGIAAGRIRELRAATDLARSQTFPAVDAVLSGGPSRSVNAFGKPLEQTAVQPQVQVSYEIDLFGRLSDQQRAARSSLLAGIAARDALQLTVAAATATTYITLRGLDARLTIARATLEARAEALRVASSRVRSGYSSRLELDQAQAERDATAQIVPSIELAIARTENALSVTVGDVPGGIQRGLDVGQLVPIGVPVGLPSELLRRRPDVAQAELVLAASDSSLRAARKRFLPQLRLSGAAGGAISTLLTSPISIWSLGGSVLAPLFQGGRLHAQSEVAGAQRDQAAFSYRRTALVAFREVEDTLAAIARIDEQTKAVRSQRDALSDGLARATARYREGYSPYLEQLDAERGLLAAELALVQLEVDRLMARIQLAQAVGGGWSGMAPGEIAE